MSEQRRALERDLDLIGAELAESGARDAEEAYLRVRAALASWIVDTCERRRGLAPDAGQAEEGTEERTRFDGTQDVAGRPQDPDDPNDPYWGGAPLSAVAKRRATDSTPEVGERALEHLDNLRDAMGYIDPKLDDDGEIRGEMQEAVEYFAALAASNGVMTPEEETEDDALRDKVAVEVLCRVFEDGADEGMEEWREWYDPSRWLHWSRALGAFIHQRLEQIAALDGGEEPHKARGEPLVGTDRHGWPVWVNVTCVECPDCGFTMDAAHEDDGGGYTCPNCTPSRGVQEPEASPRFVRTLVCTECAMEDDESIPCDSPGCENAAQWVTAERMVPEVSGGREHGEIDREEEPAARAILEALWEMDYAEDHPAWAESYESTARHLAALASPDAGQAEGERCPKCDGPAPLPNDRCLEEGCPMPNSLEAEGDTEGLVEQIGEAMRRASIALQLAQERHDEDRGTVRFYEPEINDLDRARSALLAHLRTDAQVEREVDWEQCGRCGIRYPEVYWADDDQWKRVVGETFAGLRCLACFCEEAQAQGLAPRFEILAPSLALRTPSPDSEEQSNGQD